MSRPSVFSRLTRTDLIPTREGKGTMKKLITGAMLLWGISLVGQATAATPATSPATRPTIRQRQMNQQRRIGQGVRSGQLTAGETARLERKETRLNREIRRDRVDGGGLMVKERTKINRQQNRLSRQIYRQKHDGQVRK